MPFQHIVIDNFLPPHIATIVGNKFPGPSDIPWQGLGSSALSDGPQTHKLCCSNEVYFPSEIRHIATSFNSSSFLRFLEKLTFADHLIPDPSFNGCGLHSTGRGGRLMVHADHNRYLSPNLLHQCINIIYYCTPLWKPEYGGALQFWSRDKARMEKQIDPIFNRLLIFDTGKYSYHGHPDPLECPDTIRRNSIATYFYAHSRLHSDNYGGFQSIEWVKTNKLDRELDNRSVASRFKSILVKISSRLLS